jgi:hypothetical protein
MTALPFAGFHHALQLIGFVEGVAGEIFSDRVVSEFVVLVAMLTMSNCIRCLR